ncbi:MAG TPA: hypothetical protein O0X97_05305 [Methanocorpusculum sp.]|nr:hypothetical protein [Methanocorpusculum sp.]
MDNTDLFEDGPRLLRCDGCGRYFEEPLLKRCRACGKLFCADCRTTHDCREPVPVNPAGSAGPAESSVESAVPPVIIRGLDENLGSTEWKNEPAVSGQPQRKYTPITFLDDEQNSIGSADVRRNEGPGTYGSYQIPVPDAPGVKSAEAQQPMYQKPYAPSYNESSDPQPAYQEPYVPPYTGSSKQQAPAMEYTPVYDIPAAETTPACGPDELICDDCGRVWKKTDLRKCKKCGAVLCPNCRDKHKCKKSGKKASAKNSSPAAPAEKKYADLYPQAQQAAEPNLAAGAPDKKKARKEKAPRNSAGKKSHKKLILMVVLAVLLAAGVTVAVLMMNGIIQPLNR